MINECGTVGGIGIGRENPFQSYFVHKKISDYLTFIMLLLIYWAKT
jgi:hypothetical protein